ncbi:ABC transporter substrate-binding protein [Hydrogenophaga sp. SL48]|uniref:ABC transporter substrate-binding protein n=1 Tax=Hydrogenophaga sp. SL48 TaxID=2806347 RepID=UPI001F1898DE|nr:ABC transporter substrate-binding protein [Hydrogenophaga sp. SL48]UJW81208.1 ABC transporter substrate-binding protein [Hydrogenophaga sp. SL48]
MAKPFTRRHWLQSLAALGSFSVAPALRAADDAGNTVRIGRVLPHSVPAFASMARQRTQGADACMAHANASGGIHGQRIVVLDRDDGYDATRAARETQSLLAQEGVFALLGAFGTPTVPAVIEVAERMGAPLVGAASIANDARHPPRRWIFPVRVSAVEEATASVRHQVTLGAQRFLVLASREAYGPSGAAAYTSALRRAGRTFSELAFEKGDDAKRVATQLLQTRPEVIFISVLPKPFAGVLRAYREGGGAARIFGLSVMRVEDLRAELGPQAVGIGLSQPVPAPTSPTSALAGQYRAHLAHLDPAAQPSFHGLEGYLEARVLVEGLRRAGPRATREQLVRALESFRPLDLDGLLVRYGAGDRTGSTFTELVMLGSGASIVR